MSSTYLKRRDDALAPADRVFARLPHVGRLNGCTYCYTEDELTRLGGDPRSIRDDLVRQFAYEGIDHWDEAQYQIAWRRLAGRILALIDRDELVDTGLLLRGLGERSNSIELWAAEERTALLDALGAILDLWLASGRPAEDVIELLGALAHVHNDIGPWFARIEASTGPEMDAGLVRLAAYWAVEVSWEEEPIGWWWYPPDPLALARDWLCSQAVQQRLTTFATHNPRCKNAADALATTRSITAGDHSPWLYYDSTRRPKSWSLGMGVITSG